MSSAAIFPQCGHPRTEENSYPRRGYAECRACKRAKAKAWEVANPEKVAEKRRRANSTDSHRAKVKAWKLKNPERARATRRAWNSAQREAGVKYNNYTKEGLKLLIPRDKVAEIIETVRSTASLQKVIEIVPRHLLAALRYFNPQLRPKLSIASARLRLSKILTPDTIIAAPAIATRSAESGERVMRRCAAAVPRHYQRDLRDDVVADMLLAWWSGRLNESDIEKRAQKFINARFKSDHDKWGDLSLDTPVSEDSTATRGELMRDDQRLWAQQGEF